MKIQDLDMKNKNLPLMLLEQTQKKNEICKNLMNAEKLNLSSSQDIRSYIEQLKEKHLNSAKECNNLKHSIDDIEKELKNREKQANLQKKVEDKPEIVKAKKELNEIQQKKEKIESNLFTLRAILNQTDEELSLTKEDLTSKLLQRAEFVAQREELDEVYESTKQAYGDDFRLYCSLQEKYDPDIESQYLYSKDKTFYLEILNQIKTFSVSKD
jgi:chromosome segregation ATPase